MNDSNSAYFFRTSHIFLCSYFDDVLSRCYTDLYVKNILKIS